MEQNSGDSEKLKINLYNKDEIIKIIEGYKKLNEDGQMQEFLDQVKICPKCQMLSIEKRPFNRILNNLDLSAAPKEEAEKIIQRYEVFTNHFIREPYARIEKSVRHENFVALSDQEFYEYVTGADWPGNMGLSIGVCGWTDSSMFHIKQKAGIMIVAADWFPLLTQRTFLTEIDDYRSPKFMRMLIDSKDPIEMGNMWDELSQKAGIYFTNAMLCYRPGMSTRGTINISQRSFENCRKWLKIQIEIIKPELIITWGRQATLSVSHILSQKASVQSDRVKLDNIFSDGFKFSKLGKLKENEQPPFRIKIEKEEIYFHPLCHPFWPPNRWGKPLDYSNLRKWLGEHQWK